MFGIGPMELLVIAVFAVVFIGPQKLPEIMRQAARFLVQARRYSNDLKGQFNDVMREAEADVAREELAKLKQELRAVNPLITEPAKASPTSAPGSFDKPLDQGAGAPPAPGHLPIEHDPYAHEMHGGAPAPQAVADATGHAPVDAAPAGTTASAPAAATPAASPASAAGAPGAATPGEPAPSAHPDREDAPKAH